MAVRTPLMHLAKLPRRISYRAPLRRALQTAASVARIPDFGFAFE
jgi:hypothetical protein